MRTCQHYFIFPYYHCILCKLYAPSLYVLLAYCTSLKSHCTSYYHCPQMSPHFRQIFPITPPSKSCPLVNSQPPYTVWQVIFGGANICEKSDKIPKINFRVYGVCNRWFVTIDAHTAMQSRSFQILYSSL